MADIEKVMKGIEACKQGKCDCRCSYVSIYECRYELMSDALELLKEYETLEMRLQHACECYEELEKEYNKQTSQYRRIVEQEG